MSLEERVRKIGKLAAAVAERKEEIVEATIRDVGFARKDAVSEINLTIQRLNSFGRVPPLLAWRTPVCRQEEEVAILLPYDGNTWMNTAILSVWLPGNRVRVKFSSKGSEIGRITEEMYRPIFGGDVRFDFRGGREFMEASLRDPRTPVICVFGSDRHVLPYAGPVRQAGKKLIFEGPGNDPFIILGGADLEAAVSDLLEAKYRYSGQTCVAPERVLVHRSLYQPFLEIFTERTGKLAVGTPDNPEVDVVPLASSLAAENIGYFLEDARRKGGRVTCGGRIEGNLVYPTVVADANEFMWGMREEVFGPVSFVAPFDAPEEAVRVAKANRYGLRATVHGETEEARKVAAALRGADYLHEVPEFLIGRFGTVSVNEPRSVAWRDALITKPVGGYAYSGWVWETVKDRFVIKQGPRLFSLETSRPAREAA